MKNRMHNIHLYKYICKYKKHIYKYICQEIGSANAHMSDWEYLHRLSERLASLRTRGAKLRTALKSHDTIVI